MTKRELNLTTVESALTKKENIDLFPLVVAATNSEGFYLSKGGGRMFPVIINEREVEVVNADNPSASASFLEGSVRDYSFEIDNTILPADLSGEGGGSKVNFWRAVKSSGFAILEKDGHFYVHEMTHVCSGSSYDMWQEAFANILLGKGIETKIEEIPERAFSMVGDVFLDIYGTPLGKDSGLVILYGERNGNRVLRFRCSDKSLKKAVPGKKSPLFPTINEVWSGVSVLAKPAFTTASGLTICDPVRILNQW